jgi:hypothetical protein
LGTLGLHDRGGRFASGAATALLPPVAVVAIAYDNRACINQTIYFSAGFARASNIQLLLRNRFDQRTYSDFAKAHRL